MQSSSRAELVRSRSWQVQAGLALAAVLFAFYPGLRDVVWAWVTKADYSHGLLLVPFAAYLLWRRRELIPETVEWPSYKAVPLFAAAIALHIFGEFNVMRELVRGLAVLLALLAWVVMFLGGTRALIWAWPAFAFVALALPLPFRLEHEFSLKLQLIAVKGSTFIFQLIGLAAYQPPNQMRVIIGDTHLEVERACSGLSMLLAFVAMASAIAYLSTKRPVPDRWLIAISSIPIAVICNIGRIVVTGLVYHAGWKSFGDFIVHDLAGWLMMPVALAMIWFEMRFIDWILLPRDTASTDEVTKANLGRAAVKAAEVAGIPIGPDGKPLQTGRPGAGL